jgi:hypothetical protein
MVKSSNINYLRNERLVPYVEDNLLKFHIKTELFKFQDWFQIIK